MRRIGFCILVLAIFAMPAMALAQVCGDADNYGSTDLGDAVAITSYIGAYGPTPANPALADCDGRAGVTVSDIVAIFDSIFNGLNLDCSAAGVYSNTYTDGELVYWPYMLNVPDGINSVSLPVAVLLQPGSQGYYLPFLNQGAGANSVFRLDSISYSSNNLLSLGAKHPDTSIILTARWDDAMYQGVNTLFVLHYGRVTSGVGNIVPQLVDRSALWYPSLERDGDLFRMAVMPTEQFLPPETLKTTPATLAYSSMAGKVAPDSFLVSFSSTGVPISFTIAASDPWITLLNVPPGGYTTPASVWVKADATAIGIGDYAGQITMTPTEPGTPVVPDAVIVTFHVILPVTYPPGDFNCDGICDITDLATIVSYLTGGGAVLHHCNQF